MFSKCSMQSYMEYFHSSCRSENSCFEFTMDTEDSRFTDRMGEMLKKQEGGREVKMCEYIDMLEARGEARGKEKGKEIGKEIGENMLAALLIRLYALGREGDVKLALENKDARKELYQEFTIAGKYQGPGA